MPSYHTLNRAALSQLIVSPQGGVAKDLMRRGLKVESAAKRNLGSNPKRVNTGRLRASLTHVLVVPLAVRIGTNLDYARYVHDGTGIFGPYSEVIRPKTKKALRWKAKGGGKKSGKGYVYAKYTVGMRPNPFLKNALSAARG